MQIWSACPTIEKKTKKLFAVFLLLLLSLGTPIRTFGATIVETDCKESESKLACAARGGIKHIYIYDHIDEETARTVASINGLLPIEAQFPTVYLNSRGGDPAAAVEIGRVLRLRSATVEGKNVLQPSRQALCDSACVIIAAGAVRRNLHHIGLHKGHTKKRIKGFTYEYADIGSETSHDIYAYFDEMKINPRIKEIIEATPFDEFTQLDYDLDKPFMQQEIVRLGFLMTPPSPKDAELIRALDHDDDWNATEALTLLAKKGDKEAAFALGERFLHGLHGEKKDIMRGKELMEKAADMGHLDAMHNLAVNYENGFDGFPQNKEVAIRFYKRASVLGLASSQNNLGWIYYTGDGVRKSVPEAIFWITKAAEQGEPFAFGSIAAIRFEGNGLEMDDVETYMWCRLAVDHMPNGRSRREEEVRLAALQSRMKKSDIEEGEQRAKRWSPLKQSRTAMMDKDDRD